MRSTADAIVIGGGSTGCSIAYYLLLAGMKVILLERDSIASGTTGYSPAIIRQNYPDMRVSRLVQDSIGVFKTWHETVGGDCGYVRCGFLTAFSEPDAGVQTERAAAMAADGMAVALLSADEIRTLQPDFVTDGVVGGVLELDGGYCDPIATVESLARAIIAHGGALQQNCEVTNVRVSHHTVTGVDTRGGSIDTPIVVNAAGAWAAKLAATCGRNLPIEISGHGIAILAFAQASRLPRLFAYQERRVDRLYMRALMGGLYIVGSFDPKDSYAACCDEHSTVADAATAAHYKERAAKRFGRFAEAKVQGGWASVFDDTPDGNPLIGADPEIGGLYVAAGMNGHCFKMAPVIGKGLADIVTTGRTDLDLEVFALDRFSRAR